jgi:hypothetical protein
VSMMAMVVGIRGCGEGESAERRSRQGREDHRLHLSVLNQKVGRNDNRHRPFCSASCISRRS